jgi:uncharacterized membrane protein
MNTRERRLLIALVVSLSLNLFLVGFSVARWFGPRPHPGRPGPFRVGESFDMGRSPEMRARFERKKDELGPKHRDLREARKRVEESLLAEPYDRTRVEQALAALRQETTRVQEGMHGALLDLASELPPERRRELVRENFGDRRRGGPRHER